MSKEAGLSPWEVLGVRDGAPADQVRAAFVSLVKYSHPDLGGEGAAFRRLWSAYRSALAASAASAPKPVRAGPKPAARRARVSAAYSWRCDPGRRTAASACTAERSGHPGRSALGMRSRDGLPTGPLPDAFATVLGQELARAGLAS